MREMSPEVFVADQPIVNLGIEEMDLLKEKVAEAPRHRIRICAHADTDDRLHEMLIVCTKDSYIRPGKHLGKDESAHVLEGIADYVFFDEEGNLTDVIPLGDYASGRQFYCRIPAGVNHALVLRSEVLAIHESTEGPFDRADTVFAPWSPDEADTSAARDYSARLTAAVDEFIAGRG